MTSTETTPGSPGQRRARDKRMSLGAHLVELRRRLLISVIGIIVGMIAGFILSGPIIELLIHPINLIAERTGHAELNVDTVSGGFDMRMRIAFVVGIFLSAPVWLSQIWLFIMPGLTRKELRYTVGFLCAAIPLFFAGLTVGWLLAPHVIELMSSFVPDGAVTFFQYSYYMDFILKLLLVIGVAFVLPVFLVLLNVAGVLSGMAILRGWRVAILVITIFAAAATPAADVTSMLILAGILVVLYFAAAGVSLLFDRRRAKRDASILPPEAPA
ncbi:twin-arginine translocase subunit TatC [Microbacterium sp. Root61]|uniref:twin-arginine translocase subunit TatC n=1 Tax=Microbacterium sp. Root61 TaxID=1736570 RepID=UPI003FA5AAF0